MIKFGFLFYNYHVIYTPYVGGGILVGSNIVDWLYMLWYYLIHLLNAE